jgi:hypothetical protein
VALLREQLPEAIWEWLPNTQAQAAACRSLAGLERIFPRRVRGQAQTLDVVKREIDEQLEFLAANAHTSLMEVVLSAHGELVRSLSSHYWQCFIAEMPATAFAEGEALLTELLRGHRHKINKYKEEVPVSDSELLQLLGVEGYRSALAKALPDTASSVRVGRIIDKFAEAVSELCYKGYKQKYSRELGVAKAQRKAVLAQQPAVQAAELVRERVRERGLSVVEVAALTESKPSLVRKLMMRSTRTRSQGNSGRIASLDSTKLICNHLGLDWAAIQLATLTVELPGAQRRADGRLHSVRYRVVEECLAKLRAEGAPADILRTIQDHADGHIIVDKGATDTSWQSPFCELLERERLNQGMLFPKP